MKKIIKKIGVYALIFILIFNNIYIENIMLVNAETNLHEKIEKKDNQKKEKNIVLQIKDEYKNVLLGCANESIDYIFEGENIDKKDLIWTSSNDEIVQVNDGRILSNKEGSAVVTVSTKDEKISDNITINVTRNIENNVQSIANEDLTEVVFENGITYEINSSESFYINPVDYRFKYDIISYDSLGKILYSRINDSGQIYIHGGGIVKIRLRDEGNCKFSIPIKYKHFIKTNNNEIFYKITLLKEKGYEINNTTNNTIYMAKEYGYSYYKYITYRKKGNEKGGMDDININSSVYGNKEIRDSAIYRIEMNEDTYFYIPYELKDKVILKELKEPLLEKITLLKEKGYEINNTTNNTIYMAKEYGYSYYKYITYRKKGNEKGGMDDININSSVYGNKEIRDSAIYRIEMNEDTYFYIPYELKDKVIVKELKEPLLEKITLLKEKGYEINNTTNNTIYMAKEYGYSYYKYITYRKKGNEKGGMDDININSSVYGNKEIRDSAIYRIEMNENTDFYIPYELKDKVILKELKEPLLEKITLLKEKGYEINNTTNNTIYMAKEYGYSYYKYITYRKKGNEKGGMDDININSSVYGNKEIRDSAIYRIEMNENTDFYIPYELKDEIDIKPLSNPILYEKEIKNKEVFALKNETAFSIQIINTSNYSEKTYDITKYDSNGKIIMSSSDTYGTIILNSGESFIINSSNGYPITFYTAYEAVSNEGPIIEAVKIKEIIWYDIINNEYRVDKSNKAVKKIKVDVNWNGKEAGEIMLKQGNNTISSTNGVFELVLGNNFNVNQDIYAVCKSKDGTYSNAKKLALKIVNSVIDLKDLTIPSTKLGSTISTTPILAANDFAYQFLPIKFITSFDEKTGTLKVIIGSQEAYSLKKFNKEYEKAKKAYNLGVAFGERTSYSLASKWKMDLITVGGYIEARVVNGDIKIIEGGININGKPNCAFGTQTFIGPVPVYASAKGVVDLGFSSKLLKDGLLNTGELKLTGDFNIGPNITPEVGVGIKGLNTGARGKLKLNAQATYNPLSTNFSVYGGIGLQATVLSKTYATEMISREWATKGKSSEVNLLELEEFDIFDTTKYSLMDRGYLNETSSWLSEGVSTISHDLVKSNEKIEILQNGVLPTTEPMLAKVGDKKVLVWLRDNEKRSSINRTEVVYSIYNEESGIWTLPQSIYDDGTADYYPNISFYGDDLFVVWQNTKKVMNDSSSIEEIAKESEIVVSKFNISNNKFDKPISITSNNVYDGVPEIITKDGKAYITWIRNSNNDIFGAKGNNSLMSSYFDGSKWASEKVLVKDVKGSSGVSMAYNNDEVYIIYDMDTDGNLETLEDKEIYYITSKGGRAKKLTNNKVIDSNPQFIENNKGLGIIWYSNGELLYSDTINKLEGKAVFKNEVYTGTDNFKVIQNNNSLAILWKENIDEIIEVYGALYDSKNNTLSEKIKITNTEERVKTVNALFNNDGDIQLVLNVSEKIPKEIDGFSYCDDGNSRLEVINIDLGYDIQIEENSLYVDDSEFKTNNPIEVSVKIKNNGQLAIDKVKVDFIEGNLSSGLTINNTEEITVNLKPGESKEISTKFIPKKAKNYNVQMKVTPVSGEDVYIKDNVVEFTCGYPDISIETLYASENIINIEIANKSSIPASNITLNIKEDSEDGKILKTIYIDSLYSDNSHIEKVKLDNNINYDNNGEALLYVEALTEEKYTYNNHSNIIISKQFDIEDINKDGKIDILDIALAANKYNLFIEDKEWDYKYDINLDGIIDIFDIILLSKKVS